MRFKMSQEYRDDIKAYNSMLYDICFSNLRNKDIAEKYSKSAGYISQISKKVSQLKYKPKNKDGHIICTKCEKFDEGEKIQIHHNHETGEQIAILCSSCNCQLPDDDLIMRNCRTDSVVVYLRAPKGIGGKEMKSILKRSFDNMADVIAVKTKLDVELLKIVNESFKRN